MGSGGGTEALLCVGADTRCAKASWRRPSGQRFRQKNPQRRAAGFFGKKDFLDSLFDEASFDGLDGNEHTLGAAVGELHLDALQVRPELAGRDGGHVRTDAAALFALTFTMDTAALDGTFACDCADSGHG